MNQPAHSPSELEGLYGKRFEGIEEYRRQMWRILIDRYFSRWTDGSRSVLDLGCGYGEFINQVSTPERFAMDLNPATRQRLETGIQFFEQDCSSRWPLGDNSLDLVFTSNFFEHLPSKQLLTETLRQAFRCLRPGGRLIALGPNIRYLPGAYWDFYDHYLPLSERSLEEVLLAQGFCTELVIDRFLPYTAAHGRRPPVWTVGVYLSLPIVWRFLGKQFLVVGRKPE